MKPDLGLGEQDGQTLAMPAAPPILQAVPPPRETPALPPTPARPKRHLKPIHRLGYEEQGRSAQNGKQLSPRERKKRKGEARKLVKRNPQDRWVMEPGRWFQSPKGWQKRGAAD